MAARRPHTTLPHLRPPRSPTSACPPHSSQALAAGGITTPFPIQTATLPDTLAGRDVLGRGRTGSGKTYAFVLPVLARLAASTSPRRPRPPARADPGAHPRTRDPDRGGDRPAGQGAVAAHSDRLRRGGAEPADPGLRAGVDVLVACPGRLADHVRTGHARLDAVEITVLDEADHMADLGFLPVVRRLLDQTPRPGQRLLFSATLDAGVDVLVRRFLTKPVTHSVDSAQSPVAAMTHHVLHVRRDDRLPVLVDLAAAPGRTLVFTRTKHGAKTLTRQLVAAGVPAVELHGNLAQNARNRNLLAFSEGSATTLVATDIAARGIHVDDVALVIHADPPVEHKAYLHRSGRTARAGAHGTVVTLMTDDQVGDVRDLARKAGIAPTTTRLRPGHPLLARLAPGQRSFVTPRLDDPTATDPTATKPARHRRSRRNAGPRSSTMARTGGSPAAAPSVRSGSSRADRRVAAAPARPSGAAAFSARTRV